VEALERDIVSRNPSIHWLEYLKFWIKVEDKTGHSLAWCDSSLVYPLSPDYAFIYNMNIRIDRTVLSECNQGHFTC
jgi:hypothetical protein